MEVKFKIFIFPVLLIFFLVISYSLAIFNKASRPIWPDITSASDHDTSHSINASMFTIAAGLVVIAGYYRQKDVMLSMDYFYRNYYLVSTLSSISFITTIAISFSLMMLTSFQKIHYPTITNLALFLLGLLFLVYLTLQTIITFMLDNVSWLSLTKYIRLIFLVTYTVLFFIAFISSFVVPKNISMRFIDSPVYRAGLFCQNDSVIINCPNDLVTEVLSVNFGTPDGVNYNDSSYCSRNFTGKMWTPGFVKRGRVVKEFEEDRGLPRGSIKSNDPRCVDQRGVTASLQKLCSKSPSCKFEISDQVLKSSPCPSGWNKFLVYLYKCVKANIQEEFPIKVAHVCEGDLTTVSCPRGHELEIIKATYGYNKDDTCAKKETNISLCEDVEAYKRVVLEACAGKSRCVVDPKVLLNEMNCTRNAPGYFRYEAQCVEAKDTTRMWKEKKKKLMYLVLATRMIPWILLLIVALFFITMAVNCHKRGFMVFVGDWF